MQRFFPILSVILATALASACAAPQQAGSAAPAAKGPTATEGAGAQAPPPALPVVTEHSGTFNGVAVRYRAIVEPFEVADVDGNPGARLVSIAYVAGNPDGAPPRPVMFVFNGGPIAPSVYLHLGAFGPWRVAFSDDLEADPRKAELIENPHSLLDVADLVYFDPAGTGFSRALPGKELRDYFSVASDAQQLTAFIAAWLERHDRRDSPVYIFGESYGTMRAAEAARQLAELPEPILAEGVVLFGQAVNIIEYAQRPDNIISYVVSLPTLAALGWYHGKAQRVGLGLDAFVAAAWEYARTDYLDALFQGLTLPRAEMEHVARRLEVFTGLDAGYFLDRRLRVSKEEYRVALFAAEGLVLGRSDGRYFGPRGEEEAAPDPAEVLPRAVAERFPGYLEEQLGVVAGEAYLTASPVQGLDDWNWGEHSPFSRFAYGAAISALFAKNPEARVLVGAGYFDTMTTTGASQYLVNQADWPPDRVRLEYYFGGHMAYSDEGSARQLAADLRSLIGGD
jgi:carboxypeptidase C (cathepsin A)